MLIIPVSYILTLAFSNVSPTRPAILGMFLVFIAVVVLAIDADRCTVCQLIKK